MTTGPRQSRPHTRTPPLEPIPNWTKLSRADAVDIYRHGEAIASGSIDMLAMDGSVFWLIQDGGHGRALFLHSDGVNVFRRARKPGGKGPRRY